jgi:hypothetical protein
MRKIFNDGNYWQRATSGDLRAIVLEDAHPSRTLANEPFCTHSQMVSYRDADNNEVARVHQYLRPDKTIGASGRPDPKRILENGILYRLPKNPQAKSV